jgi:hypothetical protein
MPVHDWTRVDVGLFHAFHQQWIVALCNGLNAGLLPPDYFALPEQHIRGPIPDVLALHLTPVAIDGLTCRAGLTPFPPSCYHAGRATSYVER